MYVRVHTSRMRFQRLFYGDRTICTHSMACCCFRSVQSIIISRISIDSECTTVSILDDITMTLLAKLDRVLSHYFITVAFLHVAHWTRTSLEVKLLDVLATTCIQSDVSRRRRNVRHSSVLSLSQAAVLMKVVANNSRSTVQLIVIELSKAYLYTALRCKDSWQRLHLLPGKCLLVHWWRDYVTTHNAFHMSHKPKIDNILV